MENLSSELNIEEPRYLGLRASFWHEFFDTVVEIVVLVIIFVVLRAYVIYPFQINGDSMQPSFASGEYILTNKFVYANILGYKVGNPQRGEVVVFYPPVERKVYFIKRVIGLPGEKVVFKDNVVYIYNQEHPQGFVLPESYVACQGSNGKFCDYAEFAGKSFEVPPGQYFLLGDNRNNSTDSRRCFESCYLPQSSHYVPREKILGKALVVLWPFNNMRMVKGYAYN